MLFELFKLSLIIALYLLYLLSSFFLLYYAQRKFSVPAPISKWYLAMPRSIWV